MDVTPELITELFLTITHPTDGFLFVLPTLLSAKLIKILKLWIGKMSVIYYQKESLEKMQI